jgi:hypothetical protein
VLGSRGRFLFLETSHHKQAPSQETNHADGRNETDEQQLILVVPDKKLT